MSDEEALRALHDAHAGAVWRYVVHLTGDRAAADDTLQEVLVRAWRNPAILAQDPSTARSWLFTVARHLVIDDYRSARRRHELVVETLPEAPVDDRMDALFESILIEEALATISREHRTVIVRCYYGGRTIAEAAHELDLPEGTIKSRLHYGLRALRLALQEKGVTR